MGDWDYKPLGDFCDLRNGFAFKSENYTTEGILNFRVVNINWDGTVNVEDDTKYLPRSFAESHSQYLLKDGDILFVMVGATRGKLGRIPSRILPALMNQNMWRVVPTNSAIDPDFLFFFLRYKTADLLTEGEDQARGFFKKSDFNSIEVPIPLLPEQKKIAHILSTVQRAIEEQERIIQTTTELKKALMQKLFNEGLRGEPQKETEIGLVPESWEVVEVGTIVEVKGGKRFPKGEKLVAENTGLPYIRVTDFNDFSIDTSDLRFLTSDTQKQIWRYIINKTDVFISIAGSIGISGMIPVHLDGANLTENAARLIAKDTKNIFPRYLMYWLASEHCQGEIRAQTVKNAQPKLALTRIKSLKIPLPPIEEQKEIAANIDLSGQKNSNSQKKKTSLEGLFRTLLYELMTAKTQVRDLELPA